MYLMKRCKPGDVSLTLIVEDPDEVGARGAALGDETEDASDRLFRPALVLAVVRHHRLEAGPADRQQNRDSTRVIIVSLNVCMYTYMYTVGRCTCRSMLDCVLVHDVPSYLQVFSSSSSRHS